MDPNEEIGSPSVEKEIVIDDGEEPIPVELEEELKRMREEADIKNVSTVRLKLAAAQLQDFHSHASNSKSFSEGLPTIWSFDKFSLADDENQSLLRDMESKICFLKNRPRSAGQVTDSEYEPDANDDTSGTEFPETLSLELTPAQLEEHQQNPDTYDNNGEALVAKVQELLASATYRPDNSLQWQVDNDRVQRLQAMLNTAVANRHDEYENDDDCDVQDNEDDIDDSLLGADEESMHRAKGDKLALVSCRDRSFREACEANKVTLSRIDHESMHANDSWCLDQQQQVEYTIDNRKI
jgi:hypothetical protein